MPEKSLLSFCLKFKDFLVIFIHAFKYFLSIFSVSGLAARAGSAVVKKAGLAPASDGLRVETQI